jgi:hypothetical protein
MIGPELAMMTAKERLTAAMRREEVDYLPCSIYFNSNLGVPGYDLTRRDDHIRLALDLGTDPVADVGLGHSLHPDVKTETWTETVAGEPYPILWQAWDTPAGRLTQAVRVTPETAERKEIAWDDFTASNLYKPLVETREDVARLAFVYAPQSEQEFGLTARRSQPVLDAARRHSLPVRCRYGSGLSNAMFMMGAANAVLFAMDEPEAFEQMAEVLHRTEMKNIELAHRLGVDILKRFGGYEMTNFYNPGIFDSVCAPRLEQEVEAAHERGMLIYYRVVTGTEPLLDRIASIGFDCIEGGEPRLSRCSLEAWHDAFAGKAASWTGISTPVLLGGADPLEVRREVRKCIEVFGQRGFILGVTNSIRDHFPWENTLALVDEWKKARNNSR